MTDHTSTIREWSTDMPTNETKVYGSWDDYDEGNYKTEVKPTSSAKAFLGGFASRFKENMADYFDEKGADAFDFTGQSKPGGVSVGTKVDAFTSKIFPNFVKDYGPQQGPITIQGTPGQPGLLSQIAGPVAGAAASAMFCDMRLKHDVDCLTDMNLVKDDLADVAYFVKELQVS